MNWKHFIKYAGIGLSPIIAVIIYYTITKDFTDIELALADTTMTATEISDTLTGKYGVSPYVIFFSDDAYVTIANSDIDKIRFASNKILRYGNYIKNTADCDNKVQLYDVTADIVYSRAYIMGYSIAIAEVWMSGHSYILCIANQNDYILLNLDTKERLPFKNNYTIDYIRF